MALAAKPLYWCVHLPNTAQNSLIWDFLSQILCLTWPIHCSTSQFVKRGSLYRCQVIPLIMKYMFQIFCYVHVHAIPLVLISTDWLPFKTAVMALIDACIIRRRKIDTSKSFWHCFTSFKHFCDTQYVVHGLHRYVSLSSDPLDHEICISNIL